MRTVMTVDPRLMQLLGKKLYSSHPLPIVVRELLQNARDACVRKGVEPLIKITIAYNSPTDITVTCTDNGIGMTEQQLVEDFLCLGNTSKSQDSSAIGGFGIAKAALMRNPSWSVHSLDNYMDDTFIMEGKDIAKKERIDGTIVTVNIDEYCGSTAMIRALMMVYFSDVEVDLSVKWEGNEWQNDPSAGWDIEDFEMLESEKEYHAIKYPAYELPLEIPHRLNIEKYNIIRLNGLVQYVYNSYSDRTFNLLFELYPTCRPEEKDYPLTMSREEITGPLKYAINKIVQTADANPLSVSNMYVKPEESIKIVDGYLVRGKRNFHERADPTMSSDISSLTARDMAVEDPTVPEKPRAMKLLLHEYKQGDARDIKLLRLWREIMIECADNEDMFGIGLTGDENTNACRMDYAGNDYYLLNPAYIPKGVRKELVVIMLFRLACHEAAHYDYRNHGEMHSNMDSQIFTEVLPTIWDKMLELKRLL